MDPDPNPRRRWLRFSLRALLLLVLAIAGVLGWLLHMGASKGLRWRHSSGRGRRACSALPSARS